MNDNENLKFKNYYSTSDLALAGVLSLHFPLESIDRTNPHKALFLFKRNSHLDEIVGLFWNKGLKVEPQAYFIQIKAVKSRLYGEG